ncbi:MAG TPA: glutamine--tRNA ligase, partial [Nitratifractor sp.]|nr:glutamine--tRNA ligase [Nitratifractor sp.]
VRLKHAYIMICKEVIKDSNVNIVEIKAEYYPNAKSGQDSSGIKVKSAIQWIEAKSAKPIEVRLYDRLYKVEKPESMEDLNPNSLTKNTTALIEPAVINEKPNERFQFERHGYFYADPIDYTAELPVFNMIVGLKDSWAKKTEPKKRNPAQAKPKKVQIDGEVAPMSDEQKRLFELYKNEHKLNSEVANTLARDEVLSNFYAEALKSLHAPVAIANIVTNEVARELKEQTIEELHFTPEQIATLVAMVEEGEISSKIAKEVFEEMAANGVDPKEYVEEKGLKQISDPAEILPIIEEIIAKNPENVAKYKAGNDRLFGFFVGQTLKATGGKANPKVVNELLFQSLN